MRPQSALNKRLKKGLKNKALRKSVRSALLPGAFKLVDSKK